MSVYSLSKIPLESGSAVTVSDWHPSLPLLAVSNQSGRVSVYTEDGEKIYTFKRPEPCTSMKWHPRYPLLLCGWRAGAVTCASLDPQSNRVLDPTHDNSEVTVIVWAPTGQHAITGDKSGCISVWQCDGAGQINVLFVHRKEGAVGHAMCLTSARPAGDDGRGVAPMETEDGEVPSRKAGDQMTVMDDEMDPIRQSDSAFVLSCGFAVEVVDDQGNGYHLFDVDKDVTIAALMWVASKSNIVCLTSTLHVLYYNILPDFTAQLLSKTKISGSTMDTALVHAVWAAPGMLVTSCGEGVLRLYNLDEQEVYVLPLPPAEEGAPEIPDKPIITCVSFNTEKTSLAVATKAGRVVIWQYVGGSVSTRPEDWDCVASQETDTNVQNLSWGGDGTLCLTSQDSVRVLIEVQLKRKLTEKAMICQVGVDSFLVQTFTTHGIVPVKTTGKIRGLDVLYPNVIVWTGKKVELYQVNDIMQSANLLHTMEETSLLVALSWQGVFVARPGKVELFTLQFQRTGTPLPINESEGDPVAIDTNEEFLAVATDRNIVRVWRVGRDVKMLGTPRVVLDPSESFLEVCSIKVNSRGKKVSMLTRRRDDSHAIDTRVWVYDLDADRSTCYDFGQHSRYPTFHAWMCKGGEQTVDIEHTMLCCEICKFKAQGDDGKEETVESRLAVCTVYATPEDGAILQSTVPVPSTATCFVGLHVPNLVFYGKKKVAMTATRETHSQNVRLHDLEGINIDGDIKVREAMLKFSYNLTKGNMDEAYRVVKSVKDESVWVSMASMCVKTRRLDVAEVCLGNMQDPMSAKILKASYAEPEIEARVAALAICLGMTEEAEKLYKSCGRYDLLSKLHQYCGRYDMAIDLAEKHDRIHLRTTRYVKARYLEARGDLEAAAKLYEASNCHKTEVPRMYFENRKMSSLEQFVRNSQDSELIGWWGQYQESLGNVENALGLYERSGDTLSCVRLMCARNPPNLDGALALVQAASATPGGKAAAYHLARHFEESRNIAQAIELFSLAGAVKHTIRIARDNDMVAEVMTQSLKSSDPSVLLDSAAYFEEKQMLDKAVMMYHKGGDLQKAVGLCVRAQLFDTLHAIAENLDSGADPEVFQSCAEFFASHGQFDKAVVMLTQAKAYNEALQLCLERGVKLTDEVAEAMTLPKTENEEDEDYRISILKKIAKVAKIQESWHLACKKYTQAGDKVKAMKMLLRSGETEKIIFFANHARQKELFVLAANYLQKCDWQNDPTIYKHILLYYNKAHAYENLAVFYDTCSQLQIDEYRDYEKASVTLRESAKCLEKCAETMPHARIQQIKTRLVYVEKFAHARRLASAGTGPQGVEMVSLCQDLLSHNHSEHPEYEVFTSAVRVGDVYALLVEHYVANSAWDNAYAMIEKMREYKIELTYYLEQTVVERVYEKLGVEYKPQTTAHHRPNPGSPTIDEDFIEGGEDDD